MSDTVKLIIEIPETPKNDHERWVLAYGTPLPKGHWIEENINEWSRKVFCSKCGCPPPFEYVSDGDVYSASGYGVINKTKFCPNCGSDMRGNANAER